MRVLFVCDYLGAVNPSGAGRYVLELGRALFRRGHEVRLLAGGQASDPETDGTDGFPPVHRFPFPASRGRLRWALNGGWWGMGRAFSRLVASWKPTHLVLNQPLSGAAVLGRHEAAGLPAAYLFHSPWGSEQEASGRSGRGWRDRMERRVLSRCRRVATLSAFMGQEMARVHPGLAVPHAVVPGGADLTRFAFSSGPEGKRPVLLTVRRLVPRMGLEALLDAMVLLKPRFPEVLLRVAGRGPLEGALKAQVEALRLEHQVEFAGFVPESELAGTLGRAHLFVLPSQRLEGFGMVIPEAMACGTPVLGTPVGAIPEVLGAFDPALLAPAATAEGLASAIQGLLAAPGRLAALRHPCREYAERRFRWEDAGAAFEGLLQDPA